MNSITSLSLVLTALSISALPQAGTHNPPKSENPAPPVEASSATFSFGDFDGDGLTDVYVVNPTGDDVLLRNEGKGEFVDVTAARGLSGIHGTRAALWQDFDGDGVLDLYVSSADGKSRLFQNGGFGLFVDVTENAGVAHEGGADLDAEWIDIDGDHRPDLHVVTAKEHLLFANRGRGRFERVTLPVDFVAAKGIVLSGGANGSGPNAGTGSVGGRSHSTSTPSTGLTVSSTSTTSAPAAINGCTAALRDLITNNCIEVSTTPTLGDLYPLSTNLDVAPNGNVGMGTTNPLAKLQVIGDIVASSHLISLAPTGTPPLQVYSTTKVNGLNADLIDGLDSTQLGSQWTTDANGIHYASKVGIGNTLPGYPLHVSGTNAYVAKIESSNAFYTTLWLQNSAAGSGWYISTTGPQATVPAGGFFLSSNGGLGVMSIDITGRMGLGGVIIPGEALDLKGNIRATGQFISTAATGAPFSVASSTVVPNLNADLLDGLHASAIQTQWSTISNGIQYNSNVGIGRQPTANIFEVEGNASKTTAGSWLANSDRRIKENVHEIEGALDTLDRVRPVAFHYTPEYLAAHPSAKDIEYFNVIAQEFAEVFPDYVHDSGENGILQVDTYPALIHAVAAVRELHQVVRDQQTQISDLEARLAKLESAMSSQLSAPHDGR